MGKKKIIVSLVIVLAILCLLYMRTMTDYSHVIKSNLNIDFAANS